MGFVYRAGSIYGTEYFNTTKEIDRYRPGGELPESVVHLDAAGECNRLERSLMEMERYANSLRLLLEELRDACPIEVNHGTEVGHRVNKVIAENPLPPADSADRDGQRSYGG